MESTRPSPRRHTFRGSAWFAYLLGLIVLCGFTSALAAPMKKVITYKWKWRCNHASVDHDRPGQCGKPQLGGTWHQVGTVSYVPDKDAEQRERMQQAFDRMIEHARREQERARQEIERFQAEMERARRENAARLAAYNQALAKSWSDLDKKYAKAKAARDTATMSAAIAQRQQQMKQLEALLALQSSEAVTRSNSARLIDPNAPAFREGPSLEAANWNPGRAELPTPSDGPRGSDGIPMLAGNAPAGDPSWTDRFYREGGMGLGLKREDSATLSGGQSFKAEGSIAMSADNVTFGGGIGSFKAKGGLNGAFSLEAGSDVFGKVSVSRGKDGDFQAGFKDLAWGVMDVSAAAKYRPATEERSLGLGLTGEVKRYIGTREANFGSGSLSAEGMFDRDRAGNFHAQVQLEFKATFELRVPERIVNFVRDYVPANSVGRDYLEKWSVRVETPKIGYRDDFNLGTWSPPAFLPALPWE